VKKKNSKKIENLGYKRSLGDLALPARGHRMKGVSYSPGLEKSSQRGGVVKKGPWGMI